MVPESRLDAGRSTTPVSGTIDPGVGLEADREQPAMLASRWGRLEGGRVRARHACRQRIGDGGRHTLEPNGAKFSFATLAWNFP